VTFRFFGEEESLLFLCFEKMDAKDFNLKF